MSKYNMQTSTSVYYSTLVAANTTALHRKVITRDRNSWPYIIDKVKTTYGRAEEFTY